MSNIHNNSLLQTTANNKSLKANDAQNNSNGMGAAGYFSLYKEDNNKKNEDFIDKSDYLFGALLGLSTINSAKLRSKHQTKKLVVQPA